MNFVLPRPSYGRLRTQRLRLAELYQRHLKKGGLKTQYFTLGCASWHLGNVSSSWPDSAGYNVIILASILYNYRERGELVRSGSLASYTTTHWKMYTCSHFATGYRYNSVLCNVILMTIVTHTVYLLKFQR